MIEYMAWSEVDPVFDITLRLNISNHHIPLFSGVFGYLARNELPAFETK